MLAIGSLPARGGAPFWLSAVLLMCGSGCAQAEDPPTQSPPVAEVGGRENSVASSLAWLAAQQREDGSWNFNETAGGDAGTLDDPVRATGLALLPFFDAGHSHLEGDYKQTVRASLSYLLEQRQVEDGRSDFSGDGNLLAQAIVTCALCDAYAMTQDRGLREPAQQAINQIVFTQNAETGGWGDAVGEPGNMISHWWHLEALRRGYAAFLDVPRATIDAAEAYLDAQQQDEGAAYCDDPAATAAGLLLRRYLGWEWDEPAMERGLAALAERGPSASDMQYNYIATQLFCRRVGEQWDPWRTEIREHLCESQVLEGEAAGSWSFPNDPASETEGRLHNTVMASLILMTQVRIRPLHAEDEEVFPL